MSYSDIIRVKNLGKLFKLKMNLLYKTISPIVTTGLVLYLDGKDFTNSPPTTTWIDKSSLTYNNLVSNGNFVNTTGWTAFASTVSSTANILTDKGTGTAVNPAIYQDTTTPCVTNKKVYVTAKARVTNNSCTSLRIEINGSTSGSQITKEIFNPVINQWYLLSGIVTQTTIGNIRTLIRQSYIDLATALDKVMEVQQVQVIDLTTLFGIGSEPSQVWCDVNLPFVATSGTTISGHDATVTGFSYTSASGSDGSGGVMFDGVNDIVTLGVNTVGDSTSFTIELKFVMTANSMRTLVSKASGIGASARLLIDVYPANTIRFFGYNTLDASSGDTVGVAVAAGTLAYGTFIFDGTNFKTYINGILKQSTIGTGTLKPIVNNFNIGHRFNSAFYNDNIKMVKVYNRALTDLEIVQNYNASK